MKRYLGPLFISLVVLSSPAQALRCGTGIVGVGDSTLKLIRTCGQPTMREHFQDPVPNRVYNPNTGTYYTEFQPSSYDVWTYNFGPNRFIQRITIKNGKIDRIEGQGYGY